MNANTAFRLLENFYAVYFILKIERFCNLIVLGRFELVIFCMVLMYTFIYLSRDYTALIFTKFIINISIPDLICFPLSYFHCFP